MSTETLTTFFALLALACAAATVAGVMILVGDRVTAGNSVFHGLRRALGDMSLWLAWVVAFVTTLGSLYYSLIAHFKPCELCWYQRICTFPLAVILLVAALRRDRKVWWYAGPPALVGVIIAVYHTQLQAFPEQKTFCDIANPCTNRYVWEFGFVSLPLMNLIALSFVIVMLVFSAQQTSQIEEKDPS
jgi:disulfide bond formation protein DsbB